MSRFAARSVRATLSLGVVLVVTPGGAPHSVAHPSAALSAHVAAAAPAGPDRTVPAAVAPAPRTAVAPRANQDPALSLAALSWSQPHVNTRTETATNVLNLDRQRRGQRDLLQRPSAEPSRSGSSRHRVVKHRRVIPVEAAARHGREAALATQEY